VNADVQDIGGESWLMAIREDQKLQVQQSVDIVDLIGRDLPLKAKGREWAGLCPFHDDSKPSMMVSPQKQIYKCFACGAGGDVFSWMMNFHRMSFPEALRSLAERSGVPIDRADSASGEKSPRDRLFEANARALQFFRHMLERTEEGRAAREYVRQRGVSDAMVEAFQLGYAPDQWDGLACAAGRKGWDLQRLADAGLIVAREDGSWFDRLRHRLLFPILDPMGRPIAFGGRFLEGSTRQDKSDAKYLNTPESELFHKSRTLYGIHRAKAAIMKQRVAVVVEGYTDVIACHQHGAENVVAALGTAFTGDHAKLLRRYADRIVLVFDSDDAGRRAADRAVEAVSAFLGSEIDVGVCVLSEGKDPAELFRQTDGRARWDEMIEHAQDALAYQFERTREALNASDSLAGRQRVVETFLERLASIGLPRQPLRLAMIRQRLAELTGLSEKQVADLIKQASTRHRRRPTPAGPRTAASHAPGSDGLPEGADDPAGPTAASAAVQTPDADPRAATSASPKSHNPQSPETDLAPESLPPRMRARVAAERLLIGALLRKPTLFADSLAGGVSIDEAVTPADIRHPRHRTLYERIYQRLVDGQELTLRGLLAEFAEDQAVEHAGDADARPGSSLAAVATGCESEVEAVAGGDDEKLLQLATDAVDRITHAQRLEAMEQELGLQIVDTASDESALLEKAQKLAEFHRHAAPSPARIVKFS